jgi:hypothetical protein
MSHTKKKIWRQDKRETYEQQRRIKHREQQHILASTPGKSYCFTCKQTKKMLILIMIILEL